MDVLCVGEMVIDFLPGSEPGSYVRNAGGAPANVAIAVARNGLSAGFIGKIGRDDFGDFLIKTLEENGVENVCPETTDAAVTTMAFVTLRPDGERSFTFVRNPGADILLTPADIPENAIGRAVIVHGGSCSLSRSPAAEATEHALCEAARLGKLVSFDVNYRAPLWDGDAEAAKRRIETILPLVDLLKISEEELDLFGGEANLAPVMRKYGISLVALTRGAAGATLLIGDERVEIAGRPAQAIDATGAGDAFWGGFLSKLRLRGVTRASDITPALAAEAGRYGNVAGWVCVRRKGAIPALPTRVEIESFLEESTTCL